MTTPQLIVMLTHNDKTVANAYEVFDACKESKAQYWGFKEVPLPIDEMKRLYNHMKALGKTTFLEVVAYDEAQGLAGAEMAVKCGCDILMGTCFTDKINDYCKANHLRYMPFVGEVSGRPSILEGDCEQMIQDARGYLKKGAWGIDLLGYRYTGDAVTLIEQFIKDVDAPVCLAGGINSYERLDEVKRSMPWSFTIGSAFFDKKFGEDFCTQINTVIDYIGK